MKLTILPFCVSRLSGMPPIFEPLPAAGCAGGGVAVAGSAAMAEVENITNANKAADRPFMNGFLTG
jgi:hypothetical protein